MKYIFKFKLENSYYYNLLDFLSTISKELILVERRQLEFDENAKSLLNELESNLVSKTYANEWPGTRLLGQDNAEISRFKTNKDTMDILKKYSHSLFDWIAPRLPEDIAFFRQDGTIILGTITHEKEYWLELNEEELDIAAEKFPRLKEGLMKCSN
jgi:hypothetical protein